MVMHPLTRFLGVVPPLKMLRPRSRCASTTPAENNVGALVGDLKIRLFRAHVIRFARHDFTFVVHEETAGLGDAEVGQLHVAFESDHDVFEADIAVHDAERFAVLVGFGMRVSEAAGDAADDENGQFVGELPFFIAAVACANCSRFTPRINSMAMK